MNKQIIQHFNLARLRWLGGFESRQNSDVLFI
uniref:Uncharacterized protein n=1 Tax=Siphoviridae sp. ctEkS11 TaxID=2827272 RepID=A0A8S5R3K5_9CAUD|nr:MAG TPA: hypothetical protein [Siphoviridae sp. ctEkS11]